MAPHSSTLAWKIPWTEEPGRLQSMGSLRVGHTERLHFHFSLSCIGEGNGNPLQCSCLENPRDGVAWWAAIYGVAQSWTRLKRLSSSSSSSRSEPLTCWRVGSRGGHTWGGGVGLRSDSAHNTLNIQPLLRCLCFLTLTQGKQNLPILPYQVVSSRWASSDGLLLSPKVGLGEDSCWRMR